MWQYDNWFENFQVYIDLRVTQSVAEVVQGVYSNYSLESDLISSKYFNLPQDSWYIEINDIINGVPLIYPDFPEIKEAVNE
jgi:hypothetical protein